MPVDTKRVVVGTSIVLGSAAALYCWRQKRRKSKPPPTSQSAPEDLASALLPSTSTPDFTDAMRKDEKEEAVMEERLKTPEFGPNLSWSAEVEKETAAMARVSVKESLDEGIHSTSSNVQTSQVSPASSAESVPPVSAGRAGPKNSDSPFAPSDQHSEPLSSQLCPEPTNMGCSDDETASSSRASLDSGRGGSTAPGPSPPVDQGPIEPPPIYEFEIPQHIVGLIIGKKGVVIKDLTAKSGTWILIRDHNWKDNYKICTIEGTREQINSCLRMIRRRFPPSRYPDLNLNPLLPPPIASPNSGMWGQMVQLQLPEGISCEVVVSAIVDAGHVFVQQPTHPSFTSLNKLDQYMIAVYSQPNGIPALPQPVELGVVCAAPALGGWYRALTVDVYEASAEVLVKFVDYGGYTRLPAADLKQIRSDFMSLPFQATECYLANVVPNDDDRSAKTKKWKAVPAKDDKESSGWTQEAAACVEELLCHKMASTEMGAVLVGEGHARWANPPSPEHRPSGGPFRQPPPAQAVKA